MSGSNRDVGEAVDRILRIPGAPTGEPSWDHASWTELDGAGFADVLAAGSETAAQDLRAVAEAVGAGTASVPLVEVVAARHALAELSEPPDRPGTVTTVARTGPAAAGSTALRGVAWAPVAERLVILHDAGEGRRRVGVVALEDCDVVHRRDVADDPVGDVTLPARGVVLHPTGPRLETWLSLGHAARTLGAARRVLELSAGYARTRHQFGRPIIGFQAVSHQLAHLSGVIEMLDAMVEHLAENAGGGERGAMAATAARLCAADAAAVAVDVGHQVHGAIGVTAEYDLQRFTRRLLAWSAQLGPTGRDAAGLGRAVHGDGTLWNLLTAGGPR